MQATGSEPVWANPEPNSELRQGDKLRAWSETDIPFSVFAKFDILSLNFVEPSARSDAW